MNKTNALKPYKESLNRIKFLTLMQIGDKLRDLKNRDKKKLAFKTFLFALLAIGITAAMIFLFSLIETMFIFTPTIHMLTTVIFLTQVFTIFSCLGNVLSVLYLSKENSILLAYPCKHNEIFISKIIVFLIDEFKKSIFFVLPFLISFGVSANSGWAYFVFLPLVWIFMCSFPVLVSACISILVIQIKKFLEDRSILYSVLIGIFMIALFTLVVLVISKIPTPLRIASAYGSFLRFVETTFIKINKFATLYNCLAQLLFGEKIYINLPIILAICIVLLLCCYFVAMPFYFKRASDATEKSSVKKHKRETKKSNNIYMTFLKKETKLLFRNSNIINSAVKVVLFYPAIVYIMNFVVAAINTTALGNFLIIGFNVMIILSLLSVHNSNSAMALSSEGSEFAVLKTAPSKTSMIGWAKLTVSGVVNLLAVITTTSVILITTKLSFVDVLLTALVVLIVSLGHMITSLQLDIMNPLLHDYMEKGDAVVDNKNVGKAVVIGFVVATLAGVLTILLLRDAYVSGWVRIILLAVAFLAARIYLYNSHLKVYFDDIQM